MNESTTRWELWKHESAGTIEYQFFPGDNATAKSLLTPGSELIGEVIATTDVEAHSWRNELLGWEPYRP